MRKIIPAFILCCLLALLPLGVLASETQSTLPPDQPQIENSVVGLIVTGERTSGITFYVRDVYFDGLQLQVSVTQMPNDLDMNVYEEDVYEMDPAQNAFVLGKNLDFNKGQIGAYCQVTAYDEDHREMFNSGGESKPDGNALTQTDYFNFTPYTAQNTVHVEISCGVIEEIVREDETPEWQTVELDVPIQNPAVTQTIQIAENESDLPIEEVCITQTDRFTGVFIYYTKVDQDSPDPPFTLVTDGLSEVTGATSDDPVRGIPYDYHLLQTTQPMDFIRVYSRVAPGTEYVIDLPSGAITKGE